MFYAWKTATDFGNGLLPIARSKSLSFLTQGLAKEHKIFFVAYRLDGAWVDLTTYGPGNEDGREVSEERTTRYVRSRARRLEDFGQDEVKDNTPLRGPEPEEVPHYTPGEEEATGKTPQIVLSVDPTVVKAIFEFLALEEEQRSVAINALHALSLSAEPFKRAVEVMLDDAVDLVVEIASAGEELDEEPNDS